MNLEESNSFMRETQKKDRKKRSVIISIIVCCVLIALLFALIMVIQYQDAQTLKMFVNGNKISIPSNFYVDIEGKTYVNVRQMAELLGYTYTKGEYNQYNEEETSCYLTNNFEIITLTAEQNAFTKYYETVTDNQDLMIAEIPVTIKTQAGQGQKYTLDNEIQFVNDMIYVPFESLTDMFNMQIDTSVKNRIRMYTLEQIVVNAKAALASLSYSTISGDYENLKAMVYNLAVVGDGTNYGVISLQTGQEIIGLKYQDITFIPNLQDFLTKTDTTVGILASDGSTVIRPTEYDEISVYDEENQLYLVRDEEQYGILNRLGKVIVYADYDQIGLVNTDKDKSTQNTAQGDYRVLFNKGIPVKEGTKYGLYSVDGNELLPCVYDELGYHMFRQNADTTENTNEKPVLEIPETLGIKGLVINQNDMYGIYDLEKEAIIIPCVCTKVYSITKAAQTTYYLEYNGEQIDLDEYLEMNQLKSIKDDAENEKKETTENDSMNTTVELDNENTNTASEVDTQNTVEE